MIKAVLFDFGGVVVDVTREGIQGRLCELLDIKEAEFETLDRKHYKELLTGEFTSAEFSKIVEEKLGVSDVLKKWEQAYSEMFTINEDVMEIVRKLKKKYIVGMISDVFDIHVKVNREYHLYDGFDPVILSCEVGVAKPGKEIFELALKKLKLKAEECVFMDDREKNLIAPRKMGFHVFHFTSAQQLKQELEKLGVHY